MIPLPFSYFKLRESLRHHNSKSNGGAIAITIRQLCADTYPHIPSTSPLTFLLASRPLLNSLTKAQM